MVDLFTVRKQTYSVYLSFLQMPFQKMVVVKEHRTNVYHAYVNLEGVYYIIKLREEIPNKDNLEKHNKVIKKLEKMGYTLKSNKMGYTLKSIRVTDCSERLLFYGMLKTDFTNYKEESADVVYVGNDISIEGMYAIGRFEPSNGIDRILISKTILKLIQTCIISSEPWQNTLFYDNFDEKLLRRIIYFLLLKAYDKSEVVLLLERYYNKYKQINNITNQNGAILWLPMFFTVYLENIHFENIESNMPFSSIILYKTDGTPSLFRAREFINENNINTLTDDYGLTEEEIKKIKLLLFAVI